MTRWQDPSAHTVPEDDAACCLQELSQLGIAGKDVRRELCALAAQLPSLFDPAVERLQSKDVASAITHYAAFAEYAHPSSAAVEPTAATAVLPTLQDARTGTVPQSSGWDRMLVWLKRLQILC